MASNEWATAMKLNTVDFAPALAIHCGNAFNCLIHNYNEPQKFLGIYGGSIDSRPIKLFDNISGSAIMRIIPIISGIFSIKP